MRVLSKKQESSIQFVDGYINRLIEYRDTFRLAILGNTGIKHVIHLLNEKYKSKGLYFCIWDLKVRKPLELMNEIRRNLEETLEYSSEHPTDVGRFEEAIAKYKKKEKKEIIIVLRNFNESSLQYINEVQEFFDCNQISVIFCVNKQTFKNLDHDQAHVVSRVGNKYVECGFFEDLNRFKKFCKEKNIDFNKFKDRMGELTFNQLENEGVLND